LNEICPPDAFNLLNAFVFLLNQLVNLSAAMRSIWPEVQACGSNFSIMTHITLRGGGGFGEAFTSANEKYF
jgi:hypothetical protein